jgi:hypothetical protein
MTDQPLRTQWAAAVRPFGPEPITIASGIASRPCHGLLSISGASRFRFRVPACHIP